VVSFRLALGGCLTGDLESSNASPSRISYVCDGDLAPCRPSHRMGLIRLSRIDSCKTLAAMVTGQWRTLTYFVVWAADETTDRIIHASQRPQPHRACSVQCYILPHTSCSAVHQGHNVADWIQIASINSKQQQLSRRAYLSQNYEKKIFQPKKIHAAVDPKRSNLRAVTKTR
jgi:hypothetical protein